jgi:hypothetical protein
MTFPWEYKVIEREAEFVGYQSVSPDRHSCILFFAMNRPMNHEKLMAILKTGLDVVANCFVPTGDAIFDDDDIGGIACRQTTQRDGMNYVWFGEAYSNNGFSYVVLVGSNDEAKAVDLIADILANRFSVTAEASKMSSSRAVPVFQ